MSVKSFRRLDVFRHFGLVRNISVAVGIAGFVLLQSFTAGAAPFVVDTFTAAAGTALESHTGETGATWAKNSAIPGSNLAIDSANRLRSTIAGTSIYYSSGVPASNEYDVEADVVYISNPGTRIIVGVNGRYDTATNTGYTAWYDTSTGRWHLYVSTGGGTVELGTYTQALTPGTSYRVKLEMRTATKKVYIDGVERISSTNNANTTVGRAGVVTGFTTAGGTGLALDNFNATDAPVSTATAYSLSGPSAGVVNKTYTYTVTPNSAYTGTITPASTGSGTFSPTSLTFSSESTAKTFTYTPTSATGSPHVISISSSPGLSNPASIGMTVRAQSSQFVSDTFTDTTGINLSAHTGEIGASWTKHPSTTGNIVLSDANRVRSATAASSTYYASGTPATADYIVQADITRLSATVDYVSIAGRVNTASNTLYFFDYSNTRNQWEMYKLVSGTLTLLGTSVESFGSIGTTRTIALSMIGTSIQAYVDGVVKISVVDASITGAGRAAIGSFGAAADATGQHLDNFAAYNLTGPASSYTISGPTNGSVNTASSTFTLTPNGSYTGTITPGTSGLGTFNPTSLTFSDESTAKTFTYTPTSVSGSPHAISTTSSPAISNPSSVNYTVTNGATNFSVTSPNWFWSPYNTYFNGSTSATMLTMGAYSKLNFTGTSAVLSVDVSALVNAGTAAANYPKLAYSIDGATRTEVQLTPSTTNLILASGLSAGTHSLYFSMISDSVFVDHWTVPVSPVKVTGLTLDGGATITAPTLKPARAVFFGDSGTAAYDVNSGDNSIAANDASKGWVPQMASFVNAEYAQIGYGGQGYTQGAADGTTPAFPSTWHSYYNGQSRLTAGKFTPIPDYVFIMQGGNGGVSSSTFVTTDITNMRTASAAATKIFVVIPLSGAGRTNITAGYNNYKTANPTDSQVYLLDLGTLTYPTTDGVHPTEPGYVVVANAIKSTVRSTASPSMSAVTNTAAKGTTSNVIELKGVDTYWQPGTPGSPVFTISGGDGATITSQTIVDSNTALITLATGAKAGSVTITDTVANVSTTIQITEPYVPPTTGGGTTTPGTGGPKKGGPKPKTAASTTPEETAAVPTETDTVAESDQQSSPAYISNNDTPISDRSKSEGSNFNIVPWIIGGTLTLLCLIAAGLGTKFLLLSGRTSHHY